MSVELVRQVAVDDLEVVDSHFQDGGHVRLAAADVGQKHTQLVAGVLDALPVDLRGAAYTAVKARRTRYRATWL